MIFKRTEVFSHAEFFGRCILTRTPFYYDFFIPFCLVLSRQFFQYLSFVESKAVWYVYTLVCVKPEPVLCTKTTPFQEHGLHSVTVLMTCK